MALWSGAHVRMMTRLNGKDYEALTAVKTAIENAVSRAIVGSRNRRKQSLTI